MVFILHIFSCFNINLLHYSYMGHPTKNSARGLFYLRTGEDSPYSLGERGLKYVSEGGVVNSVVGGGKHVAKGITGVLG